MAEQFYLKENYPFPNNELAVLYYPDALSNIVKKEQPEKEILQLFEQNGFSNGWVNGIFTYHHFHSNTHEVLACFSGEAKVQLGGPEGDIYSFIKGDVILLPAGLAHKLIESTSDFQIVGAYPNNISPDMQKGDESKYDELKQRIKEVLIPELDPVEGDTGAVIDHWN